ncbi:MAG TPA: GatB/YqeY domain-containing protein [bacterium]|nr:GatB/YqeY domain-containing protein [bacterium]
MMGLGDRLREELKHALKTGNKRASSAIRMVLAAAQNQAIEKGSPLSDAEFVDTIVSSIKQRRESIEFYKQGHRPDLEAKESEEIQILQGFLPPPITENEAKEKIRQAIVQVDATSPKDVGKVMKVLMPGLRGQLDGGTLNRWVVELLTPSGG